MLYLIYSIIEKKYKLIQQAFLDFDSPQLEVLYTFDDEEMTIARKVLHNLNKERYFNS